MAYRRLYLLHNYIDQSGLPLHGGSIRVYLANTTTSAAVYRDKLGTIAAPNPIPLNGSGDAGELWVDENYTYKICAYDVNGNLRVTRDNVDVSGGGGGGGLSEVSHDDTLTGAGTESSPLSVVPNHECIEELEDGETLEDRGGTFSQGVDFTSNGRIRNETLYREDQPSGTAQGIIWGVMPSFSETVRMKSAKLYVWAASGASDSEMEYGTYIKGDYGIERDPIGTVTLPKGEPSTTAGYPTIAIDREIGDGVGVYIALPNDGATTSITLYGRASDDYTNEFPAIDYKFNGSTWDMEPWGYSMAGEYVLGNTVTNMVRGSDIGRGEPLEVKESQSGRLYFDEDNRKVYAGFADGWEDISKYNAGELWSGETDNDRGVVMYDLTEHTITETEATPDSIELKSSPATGELGYFFMATPNGVTHNVTSFTPKVTVSGSSSITFEWGVAYMYGSVWEFYSCGDCIVPPASAASPEYPTLEIPEGVELDDHTCVYLRPYIDATLYVEVSTDSTEVSEHVYGKLTKTADAWSHTIVNHAVAGTFTHADNVIQTSNKLTGVDIGWQTPTNNASNDFTGKLYIDTSNNAAYLAIGTRWYPITLGSPIS